MKILLLAAAWSAAAGAAELTTGAILGAPHDARAFYVREGGGWRKTASGAEWKPAAAGKLMNLRLAQGIFHDEWMTEQPFDPDRNTASLVEALDFYRRHGVLMINVSLQGGNTGYAKEVNGIVRENGYKFGPGRGLYVSAFRPDGSLKPAWMDRLARLLAETEKRGMFVNILYFYQGQDEVFESTKAIHAAARNASDWIVKSGRRNVLIDVVNEWDIGGKKFDHELYIPTHVAGLTAEVRARFREAGWKTAVSASTGGKMAYPESLWKTMDVLLVHGNNTPPERKRQRLTALREAPVPVLMNEDDNGRASTLVNLKKELESCDILFEGTAGWGYMPWVQAQLFPFRYMPASSAAVRDELPEKERDLVYFHVVLDRIARLSLTKLPD